MNLRAGKYRHLQTKSKCLSYADISIEFTRDEFKTWCLVQEQFIFSLKRPSIDRIDKSKNYSLSNIQIIELTANIAKDKLKVRNSVCECFKCKLIKPIVEFAKDKRRQTTGKTTICIECERIRCREKYHRLKNGSHPGQDKKQEP